MGAPRRPAKTVTEELCGHSLSALAISAINKSLVVSLKAFAERRLVRRAAFFLARCLAP